MPSMNWREGKRRVVRFALCLPLFSAFAAEARTHLYDWKRLRQVRLAASDQPGTAHAWSRQHDASNPSLVVVRVGAVRRIRFGLRSLKDPLSSGGLPRLKALNLAKRAVDEVFEGSAARASRRGVGVSEIGTPARLRWGGLHRAHFPRLVRSMTTAPILIWRLSFARDWSRTRRAWSWLMGLPFSIALHRGRKQREAGVSLIEDEVVR